MSRLRNLTLLTLATALLAAAPASALVHPYAVFPKGGQVFKAGSRPTFTVRDTSRKGRFNSLYLSLTRHKRVGKCGKLKNPLDGKGEFTRMRRRKHSRYLFSARTGNYDFPGFWRVTPGTYYWQALRIDARAKCGDAYSKIYKLRIAG